MPPSIFSIPEALQLGQFVLAAYDLFTANDPPGFVPPGGYSLVSKIYADDITDGVPDYKVFGFIARSGTDVVVAIRGTEGVLEWIMDSLFRLVAFPYVKAGRTEHGFTDFYSSFHTGADSTSPRVIDALRGLTAGGSVKTLRITGHSLGSALATLLAIDAAGNGVFTSPTVYTFASPRVGDKVFAGIFDSLVPNSWRIANVNDIVTQLPPLFAGYVHVDAEVPINSDDRTKHTLRCWHALLTYLNILDSSIALDAECVPT
ncbi:MAG TPA: lipase family protein [Gemmataceae bacterium]|nr:lipase family protein [Gemmataceae bacterium]